jgi:hypothetical protein
MRTTIFRKVPILAVGLLAGSVLSVGCGTSITVTRLKPAEVHLAGIKRIAITRIDGRDGDTLATMITERLVESKRFEVVERAEMDKIAAEHRGALDAAFEQNQGVELGKLLPAAALVAGSVNESKTDENVREQRDTCVRYEDIGNKKQRKVEYSCTHYTRTANALFTANMRVFDTNTGKILVTRRLTASDQKEETKTDAEPDPINRDAMLEACRAQVATNFMKLIAPYPVQEKVDLEKDSALPELEQGNEYMKRGDPNTATEFYARAVARADATPGMKPDAKARAHYEYGLGKAMSGDYDTALAELRLAQTLKAEKDWIDLEIRVGMWKKDADKVNEQMKEAAPTPPPAQQ